MTNNQLDKSSLIVNIRDQFKRVNQLKYQRALQEFFDKGVFIGDNVFETCFKLRDGLPPLAYEVSGPYCASSNEYATIGRIYERGKLIFQRDIKPQIQQRTAAMVWLYLLELEHKPANILVIGAGKLALETVKYLNSFIPNLSQINYHSRQQHTDSFEKPCCLEGVTANYQKRIDFEGYDTIIMATNTSECLINSSNINSINAGAVVVSLCTTSQTGEIASDVYARDDVNVFFDFELTRSFTADMKASEKAGHLRRVIFFNDLLNDEIPKDIKQKKNIVRLTGTPMQNVAVLDMMRSACPDVP